MFDTLIAAMLAYFREHPQDVPIREVVGNFAIFARSVRFHGWIRNTPPWQSPWGVVTFVSGYLREGWCRNGHGWGDDRRWRRAHSRFAYGYCGTDF
jgi:hypothetical protein